MEQHMNFAALKQDILLAKWSLQKQPSSPPPLEEWNDEVEPKPSDEKGFRHSKYPAAKVEMDKDEPPLPSISSPTTSTPLPNIKSPPQSRVPPRTEIVYRKHFDPCTPVLWSFREKCIYYE
jgi:hypothetical protein